MRYTIYEAASTLEELRKSYIVNRKSAGCGCPHLTAIMAPHRMNQTVQTARVQWLAGFALAAITLLAYLPVWHAGFIWDDDAYVTQNATLHDLAGLWRIWFQVGAVPQYYPLVHTTFWVEHHLWGLHPLGYHLDNVLLHVVGALLLACVLGRLQVPGAWLAAAIFALHPVQVESVAWVTERKNVLSGVFYFAAALAYLAFDPPGSMEGLSRRRWSYYWAALGLFLAALLSKTVTCSLPAALLLVRWWKNGRVVGRDVWPLLPFFALGVGLGLLTAWMEQHHVGAQGAEWSLTFADRCLVAGRAVWFYAGKLIWPAPLIFIYPRWTINAGLWWQWLFPAAAMGVVAGLWWRRRRFGYGPLVGVLFFIGTLGPALGFVNVYPMRYSFVADHFQYLASVGLMALAAAGVARILVHLRWWQRPAGYALCMVPLLGLAVFTWRQCGLYANAESLWRATLARNPTCWMAENNLGVELAARGNLAEAIQHYKRALQLEPDNAGAQSNLGGALTRQGKLPEAIQHCERALQLEPDNAKARCNLGTALTAQGKWAEAMQQYQQALQISPRFAGTYDALGNLLSAQGKVAEAVQQYQQALQLDPDSAKTRCDLGAALAAQGEWSEAILNYQRALQINPDYAEAHCNLGAALASQGRLTEAVQHYQRALELDTNYPEAHYNLGIALAAQRQAAAAIQEFERAVQLKPDYADAYDYLGALLVTQGKFAEAMQAFRQAVQVQPNSSKARYNLGLTLITEQRWDDAIEQLTRAVELKPDYALAHFNLGTALTQAGKSADALPHFRQALDLATTQGNAALAAAARAQLRSSPPASSQSP
ncbi:MAG: tetratricopeptide repeat protein [Verrucomicrobiota bacterium]